MLLNPKQSRVVYEAAFKNHFALLAVNADSSAAITDCLEAARICQSPVIIETSLWQLQGHSFGAGNPITGLARYIAQIAVLAADPRYADIPVILHADHISGPDTFRILEAAIQGIPMPLGESSHRLHASSISVDPSILSTDENIAMISHLCEVAEHSKNELTLEVGATEHTHITPLNEAVHLLSSVEKMQPGYVALWSPSLGARQRLGLPRSINFSSQSVREHCSIACQSTGRPTGIALHSAAGLSEKELHEAVHAGVVKVNWASESLRIRSSAAIEYYYAQSEVLKPGHHDFAMKAMDNGLQMWIAQAYVPKLCELIETLGARNQAVTCWRALNL